MRFEVSERIRTNKSKDEIVDAVEQQFKKNSVCVRRHDDQSIEVESIEATFGSINRTDRTKISLLKIPDGWVMLADVDYSPSKWFWVLFILLLFTYVGWALPVAFYLLHKKTVRSAIEDCFKRIKDEKDQPTYTSHTEESSFSALEKLASLRDKGIVTEAEFQAKKKQILGS